MGTYKNSEMAGDAFWRGAFFSEREPIKPLSRRKHDAIPKLNENIGNCSELWLTQLFKGTSSNPNSGNRLTVYKNGTVIYEIKLAELRKETIIGRHPDADLQLESQKLAMFHAVIFRKRGHFYIKNLDKACGFLVDRKPIKNKTPIKLLNGTQIDLPGYRLEFSLPNTSGTMSDGRIDKEPKQIPDFFYTPPPPTTSPLLATPLEDQSQLSLWREGITQLVVAEIIEETFDSKTFRFTGREPMLFRYKPGQFITFILHIDGQEVRRSYSMSSSPSRPYMLEITIKRLPGGLVSNWLCDLVKVGDVLTAAGPAGKFTCSNVPSNKLLFISGGCGITPIISMCRWITDTGSDMDVKLIASFKKPPEILFRKELELLATRHRAFQVALTLTADSQDTIPWQGYTGRINAGMLHSFVPDILDRHVFICGPKPFTENIKHILSDSGFDMRCFHSESFDSGRSALSGRNGGQTLALKEPRHKVTFAQSGLTVETDEHINLLTLAEAYGIELDYSCRAGSCGECEVKCKGKVKMSDDCEIDEKTRNAGFVYACCSTAKSDLILDA